MQNQLYDGEGRPINLTRELGRGGEGAVWEIAQSQTLVAKVYHQSVEWDKIEKLKIMARLATPALLRVAAWPTGTLHKTIHGEFTGILMPKVSGHVEIHQLYGPAQRKQQFARADWSFLVHVAMNCAAAFETVHEAGHVIGDVNQSGVLVSQHGTVHLIDCDSFQVRSGDRLFPCLVGVPQYTPPELQGQDFQFVERTREHDLFGLAIVIFHLLFMGRHPYAGRFEGSSDMPIEKAIAEGRFAFGRMAPFYQMTPPPHSLSLSDLPEPVEEMFERAFAPLNSETEIVRPSALEWRTALASVKRTLKPCTADKGHLFPSKLTACPWCAIVRAGGPNFFISVQLALEGAATELPALDVVSLWRRVETFVRPAWLRPSYPPPPAAASPLPLDEELLETALFLRFVRYTIIAAVLIAAVGFYTSAIVGWIGVGLTVVFGVWWAILVNMPDFSRERSLRKEDARLLRRQFKAQQQLWDQTQKQTHAKFDETIENLRKVRDEAMSIRVHFETEKRELEQTARQSQLHDYLETQAIPRNHASLGGPGRSATLLSFGIETAADMIEPRLKAVPGLDNQTILRLLSWRAGIDKQFVFDPKKALSPARLAAVILKYRQMQQTCEARLAGGVEELMLIRDAAESELNAVSERIQRLANEVRQADADASVL